MFYHVMVDNEMPLGSTLLESGGVQVKGFSGSDMVAAALLVPQQGKSVGS